MKKLAINIVIFLVPLALLVILLPLDKRLYYRDLSGDCFNHGIWIYDRIFNNTQKIDVAFLGSSQTINGIDDKLIQDSLKRTGTRVANLGYCRYGVDLYYVLINEILKKKKPGTIVIEVRQDEEKGSHPVFPWIAGNKEVLGNPVLFNKDYFSDIYQHLYFKLEVIHNLLFSQIKNKEIRAEDFGYAPKNDTAKKDLLSEAKRKRTMPGNGLTKMQRDIVMKFPRECYSRIYEVCSEHKIRIVFLYLAQYGTIREFPRESMTYYKYGTILVPPVEIFENPDFWSDENHLNLAGSKALSSWLGGKLKKMIL